MAAWYDCASRYTHVIEARIAYDEDVRRHPSYEDGTPRKPWHQLTELVRSTWIKNGNYIHDSLDIGVGVIYILVISKGEHR